MFLFLCTGGRYKASSDMFAALIDVIVSFLMALIGTMIVCFVVLPAFGKKSLLSSHKEPDMDDFITDFGFIWMEMASLSIICLACCYSRRMTRYEPHCKVSEALSDVMIDRRGEA